MESCDDDNEGKGTQESRDDDSCHTDSGLLNMLAEVASTTLHNDSLARKTRNPRCSPSGSQKEDLNQSQRLQIPTSCLWPNFHCYQLKSNWWIYFLLWILMRFVGHFPTLATCCKGANILLAVLGVK